MPKPEPITKPRSFTESFFTQWKTPRNEHYFGKRLGENPNGVVPLTGVSSTGPGEMAGSPTSRLTITLPRSSLSNKLPSPDRTIITGFFDRDDVETSSESEIWDTLFAQTTRSGQAEKNWAEDTIDGVSEGIGITPKRLTSPSTVTTSSKRMGDNFLSSMAEKKETTLAHPRHTLTTDFPRTIFTPGRSDRPNVTRGNPEMASPLSISSTLHFKTIDAKSTEMRTIPFSYTTSVQTPIAKRDSGATLVTKQHAKHRKSSESVGISSRSGVTSNMTGRKRYPKRRHYLSPVPVSISPSSLSKPDAPSSVEIKIIKKRMTLFPTLSNSAPLSSAGSNNSNASGTEEIDIITKRITLLPTLSYDVPILSVDSSRPKTPGTDRTMKKPERVTLSFTLVPTITMRRAMSTTTATAGNMSRDNFTAEPTMPPSLSNSSSTFPNKHSAPYSYSSNTRNSWSNIPTVHTTSYVHLTDIHGTSHPETEPFQEGSGGAEVAQFTSGAHRSYKVPDWDRYHRHSAKTFQQTPEATEPFAGNRTNGGKAASDTRYNYLSNTTISPAHSTVEETEPFFVVPTCTKNATFVLSSSSRLGLTTSTDAKTSSSSTRSSTYLTHYPHVMDRHMSSTQQPLQPRSNNESTQPAEHHHMRDATMTSSSILVPEQDSYSSSLGSVSKNVTEFPTGDTVFTMSTKMKYLQNSKMSSSPLDVTTRVLGEDKLPERDVKGPLKDVSVITVRTTPRPRTTFVIEEVPVSYTPDFADITNFGDEGPTVVQDISSASATQKVRPKVELTDSSSVSTTEKLTEAGVPDAVDVTPRNDVSQNALADLPSLSTSRPPSETLRTRSATSRDWDSLARDDSNIHGHIVISGSGTTAVDSLEHPWDHFK